MKLLFGLGRFGLGAAIGLMAGCGGGGGTSGPVAPTITWAAPAAITYGAALSATQLDATASVPGTFAYTPAVGTVPNAGAQTLSATFTPTDLIHYTTATAAVTLTVSPAPSTIAWATPAAITYGTALSATQLDATASVAGTLVYSPASGSLPAAGNDTLSVTFTPTSANYATATASVTLTVSQAASTVTWATPAPITYYTPLSATQLDATASVAGTFVYSPASGARPAAGSVPLSVTFTPASANYAGAAATTTLTVNPAVPTVTWTAPTAITYGTAVSATQLDATANGPASALTYTPATGTILGAGAQTLSVTFVPPVASNYTAASASASVPLTVNQATPVLTWATPAAVPVGTALSATQLDATAAVPGSAATLPGTFVYTPPAGTVMNTAGTQTLSVTFTPTDAVDYTTATATVSLSVTSGTTGVPSYTWSDVAIIGGGYVPGIIMHPKQQGLMYARTDVGGAYRYDATPGKWTPLTDWISRANETNTGIESVAFDPSDPQRLYLATGLYTESWWPYNGSILTSDDEGTTFTTVPMPFKMGSNDNGRASGERLAVDPNDGAIIYFGSRLNGLWTSSNHGATWSQVTSFPGTVTTVTPGTLTTSGVGIVFEIFVPNGEAAGTPTQTIYAGVSATGTGADPQALYVSKNAGQTWAAVPGAPIGLYVNHGVLNDSGTAIYFTLGDAVGPYSLNTGAVKEYTLPTTTTPSGTWTDITPPRDSSTQGGYGSVTVDAENPNVIMVSTLDHYYPVGDDLWRSTNGGTSWYSINTVGAERDGSLSPWVYFGAPTIVNTGNWVTSLQIDPFNSNHVVYGTGQTIWTTDNMEASDGASPAPSNWTVGAQGVEETVVLDMISPPSGPAHLLTQMYDLCGFQHLDLTVSPATGAMTNPTCTEGTGIDYAGLNPLLMARIGAGGANGTQLGATSTDGGTTWTPFAAVPPTSGSESVTETVAVSADGSTLLWQLSNGATSWSSNGGATWTASTNAPAQQPVVADKVNPKVFYIFDQSTGVLWESANSGASFSVMQSGLPAGGVLVASASGAGNLWLATVIGLYKGTAGGTLAPVSGVSAAWHFAEGAPAPGTSQVTYYLDGVANGGPNGFYRSTDGGTTWIQINDAQHQYGQLNAFTADPRVFGRVYLGTGGRGIIYGDSPY